jgi:hypothetical protein
MTDLTVLYITANRMPRLWEQFHREHLLRAIGDFPVVTVSMKPMNLGLGETNLLQTGEWGRWSTFCNWNRAAKEAQTEFIAIAEDDTLYHPWHFRKFRPQPDEVAYDMSRWTVMSWMKEPVFSMLRWLGGFTTICTRQLMIDALDEREALYPEGHPRPGEIGRPDSDRRMRVTRRKHVQWWCQFPTVNLAHPRGVSPTYAGPTGLERKQGEVKAIEIPYWGRASDIADIYNRGLEEEEHAVA